MIASDAAECILPASERTDGPSMRDAHCPICGQTAGLELQLRFGAKLQLPVEIDLRHCGKDNFLFVAGGRQSEYDQYYASNVNDSCHQEVAHGEVRSPISKLQCAHLVDALDQFFGPPRKVLDFGCGGASLLLELASSFPSSSFFGFEPGPAAQTASHRAKLLGLTNLTFGSLDEVSAFGPYDLVIASHVIEHVLDFDLFELLGGILTESGMLYIEVPDALQYPTQSRLEFLYYFDRLHVNHFTPQSLGRLAARYCFGYVKHFEYAFPYRDGGDYPALGMILRKGGETVDLPSPGILDSARRYIRQEKQRAEDVAKLLAGFEGVLVWGAGDNFYRSAGNGGPLGDLRNMVILDRRSCEVVAGEQTYRTMDPLSGIRGYGWPVIVTVSEGRSEISRQIADIDPDRRVLFI